MAYILDTAAVIIMLAAVALGMKKGLVKSVWRIASFVLSIALASALINPAVELMSQTPLVGSVNGIVSEKLYTAFENNAETENPSLPGFLEESIDFTQIRDASEDALSGVIAAASASITDTVIKIIAFIILLIIIKLVLAVAFKILNLASNLPLINSTNKLLGGFLGLVNALLIIYLLCIIVPLLAGNYNVTETITSTYIVKYFYQNNILLNFAIRQ